MADIALAATGRRFAPAVVAASAAGLLNATLAVTQLLSPAQPDKGGFVRTSDYLIEYQFAGALLLMAVAAVLLAGAHRRAGVRWSAFGNLAAGGYALGTAVFGISAAATAVRGTESLDAVQFPAILLWLVGGLLLAVATVRARMLPIAVGIGFAAGLPATMAIGDAGPLALAALWLAVAVYTARRS